jgi:hypothetical protein
MSASLESGKETLNLIMVVREWYDICRQEIFRPGWYNEVPGQGGSDTGKKPPCIISIKIRLDKCSQYHEITQGIEECPVAEKLSLLCIHLGL